MGRPEEIIRKNDIDSTEVKTLDVSPSESRENYIIKSSSSRYHLSFPIERDNPVHPRSPYQKINAEKHAFSRIGSETSLRTPRIIDTSDDYILVEELKGSSTIELFKSASSQKRKNIAKELGEALATIHTLTEPEIGYFGEHGVEESFSSWKGFMEPLVDKTSEKTVTKMETGAGRYLKENIDLIDQKISPVLIYGDFQAWNTVSANGEALGVIDGEAAFAGHREYDIGQAVVAWSDKFGVTESFLEGYRSKAELDEGWRERLDYYRIYLLTSSIIDARAVGWDGLVEEFSARLETCLPELL